ncbi:hypothetical protein RS030_6753, partial [Cryptosporidium xiaoi]
MHVIKIYVNNSIKHQKKYEICLYFCIQKLYNLSKRKLDTLGTVKNLLIIT